MVASLAFSLTNFRLQLLKAMVDAGHEVTAFAPEHDADVVRTLSGIGVEFVRIPMARASVSPLTDLGTLYVLFREFCRLRPDMLLPYTMKPIIYGSLAGRLAGIPYRFALFTGLGYVFTDTTRLHVQLMRRLSVWMYQRALTGIERVFVYNTSDLSEVLGRRLVRDPSRITLVPGSGIDLEHFRHSSPPVEPMTFLLIARLLRDKGILEYVEAARILRQRFTNVRFQLLGPFDPNPSGISSKELDRWVAEGAIDYLGETRDVRPFLAQCSVFVLPSYREGLPRTVLEAMATGRAIVTTDAPGCRDTVVTSQNGYIVPPRNAGELAEAMSAFVKNPELAVEMGRRSYELARERYDVHAVNRLILRQMNLI